MNTEIIDGIPYAVIYVPHAADTSSDRFKAYSKWKRERLKEIYSNLEKRIPSSQKLINSIDVKYEDWNENM